jgi:predicted metal-dependent hydrolase
MSRKVVLSGDPPVEITLRSSARMRRISLRVSRTDGAVTLSHPSWTSAEDALAFARTKADWIRRTLVAASPAAALRFGGMVPVAGVARRIVPGTGRAAVLGPETIALPGAEGEIARRLATHLRLWARDALAQACDRHAETVGRSYSALVLRDTRSRWGSCSAEGRLMFSWRLAMAPPAVLDYVAAHEVAHLVRMDHSAAFWRVVARLCPQYVHHRAWLRREGPGLMSIRFE